jgi:flagellar assembly protein FliH
MISPFETVDERQRVTRDGAVSDLLARVPMDVGGISFASLDEPEVVEDDGTEALREAEAKASAVAAAAEELRARVQAARTEALNEARRGFEMELETKLVAERKRLDQMRLEFARDRQRFFAAAESQVVKLALAVARKILHRDALADGLPLRATVKAALARVQDGSATLLRVPESEVEAWRAMFLRGTGGKVEVLGDEQMMAGQCVLETTVGKVDLGLDAQMDEVERGFGELMQEQGY